MAREILCRALMLLLPLNAMLSCECGVNTGFHVHAGAYQRPPGG